MKTARSNLTENVKWRLDSVSMLQLPSAAQSHALYEKP